MKQWIKNNLKNSNTKLTQQALTLTHTLTVRTAKSLLLSACIIAPTLHANDLQTSSATLEEAIYTEEFVGNLPKAIEQYQTIIENDKNARIDVATALLRLGRCFITLDETNKAIPILTRITKEYKDLENLSSQAQLLLQQYVSNELAPSPWQNGEYLKYINFDRRQDPQQDITVIKRKLLDESGNIQWHTTDIQTTTAVKSQVFSSYLSEDKTNDVKHISDASLLGKFTEVAIEKGNIDLYLPKENRKVHMKLEEGAILDQALTDILRRKQYAKGETDRIRAFNLRMAKHYDIDIKVVDVNEGVTVPAGVFLTTQLELISSINGAEVYSHNLWIANDAPRYLVQMKDINQNIQLAEILNTHEIPDQREYTNDNISFQLTLPNSWQAFDTTNGKPAQFPLVLSNNDNSFFNGQLFLEKNLENDIQMDIKQYLTWNTEWYTENRGGLDIHPNSIKEFTLDGQPALAYRADYMMQDTPMHEYRVVIQKAPYTYQFFFHGQRGLWEHDLSTVESVISSLTFKKE